MYIYIYISLTTNLEEEEIVDAPGNDGNASMPEHVKGPNPWRKMTIIYIYKVIYIYNVLKIIIDSLLSSVRNRVT